MATYIIDSKEDIARRDSIQTAVDNGNLPVMTTITKRPSDFPCWQGVCYGGQWYPPSDPRGAELIKMRYMLPAGKPAKPARPAPVMLGQTEIEMGEGQYNRPGLSVRHSSQAKRLFVTQYITGRTGKQKNYYPLHTKRVGDQIEISTQGAAKSVVSLADWQAFIDQVEVRVCSISRNTVALTPALVKMARDVRAFRREAPSDAQWAKETASAPKTDPGVLAIAGAVVKKINQEVDAAHLDKILDDLVENKFKRWVEFEYGKITKNLVFINLSCEKQAFGDLEQHFRKLHNRAYHPPKPKKQRTIPGPADFDRLMPKYRYSLVLANSGWNLLPSREPEEPRRPEIVPLPNCFLVEQLNELSDAHSASKAITDAPQPSPEPASDTKPSTPVFLPQSLQSKEDVLEAIAMRKLPVSPEKVDELVEAIKVAISEWNTNADARILPDGYYLRCQPDNAPVPTYILLAHPNHPNRVVVGELSIMTDKDTHSELEFVSGRGEVREFMVKVAAGMKSTDNPKLPGVLVQTAIPDDVKAQALTAKSGNQYAEIAPMEELPMFAGPDQDPEPAA